MIQPMMTLEDIRKDPDLYEVWDEEEQCWCLYRDSCYTKTTGSGFPDIQEAISDYRIRHRIRSASTRQS